MSSDNKQLLSLFGKTGALLEGYFVLRSGLRYKTIFKCALLLQYPGVAYAVCAELAHKLAPKGLI